MQKVNRRLEFLAWLHLQRDSVLLEEPLRVVLELNSAHIFLSEWRMWGGEVTSAMPSGATYQHRISQLPWHFLLQGLLIWSHLKNN